MRCYLIIFWFVVENFHYPHTAHTNTYTHKHIYIRAYYYLIIVHKDNNNWAYAQIYKGAHAFGCI